jgi:two-component system response regulator HydG
MGIEQETVSARRDERGVRMDLQLVVIAGVNAGATFVVPTGSVSRAYVGKSQACEIRLDDELVSRRHAALEVMGARLRITDLESTNGTRLNGCEIVDAYAKAGDTFTVGGTTLRIDRRPVEHAGTSQTTIDQFGQLYGACPEMRRLYPLCERLAKSDVPILIEGETGTGKEVLAESLHTAGARADKPFVVFDCTTVPPSLVESLLFGHEKGAFTGAVSTRHGVFEQAHGGTLFIDEIGDLDYPLQAKLLRAIERHDVQRVGGSTWMKTDVRIIAATRRDLEREIQAGRFRDDLFYRLAVARVELPPLRRRAGDVDRLARRFWTELGGDDEQFPVDLFVRMEGYSWPGNVRELFNRVAHWKAVGDLGNVEPPPDSGDGPGTAKADSRDFLEEILDASLPFGQAKEMLLREFERRFLERSLSQHRGNVSKAAAASGVTRRYFYVLRSRLGK